MKDWWVVVLIAIVFVIVIFDMTVNGGEFFTSFKLGITDMIAQATYNVKHMFDF